MSRYNIYTHRQNANALHQFAGAMILLGSMMLILGFLLFHFEIAAAGSGMIILAGCLGICDLKDPYHTESYHGRSPDQLERAEEDDDVSE